MSPLQSDLLMFCQDRQPQVILGMNDNSLSPPTTSTAQGQSLVHLTDTDVKHLLDLVERVRSLKGSDERRTLYMCRNGTLYSGLVYILTLLLDRLDNDHRLTVPLVVGMAKYIRPQIIPTLEQYKVLYEVLKYYKETNGAYFNDKEASPDIESRPLSDEPRPYEEIVTEGYHVYEKVDEE